MYTECSSDTDIQSHDVVIITLTVSNTTVHVCSPPRGMSCPSQIRSDHHRPRTVQ